MATAGEGNLTITTATQDTVIIILTIHELILGDFLNASLDMQCHRIVS